MVVALRGNWAYIPWECSELADSRCRAHDGGALLLKSQMCSEGKGAAVVTWMDLETEKSKLC